MKLNEGPVSVCVKQIQIQNVDVCQEAPNFWTCFNMFLLAHCENSLAMYDINNFIDFKEYLYFSFKQIVIEITVLGLIFLYFLVKYYFTGNDLKFKMHSEDEKKQKRTTDGNSHEITASSQDHESEDKQ